MLYGAYIELFTNPSTSDVGRISNGYGMVIGPMNQTYYFLVTTSSCEAGNRPAQRLLHLISVDMAGDVYAHISGLIAFLLVFSSNF